MARLPAVAHVRDIELGTNPELEAWLYHFLMENNLEYLLNPFVVASPEQLRFMVSLSGEQVYLPCSDKMFFDIYSNKFPESLTHEYLNGWRFIVKLVKSYKMSRADSRRILSMCRYRFRMYLKGRMLLPSRMIKRLLAIVLTQCGDSDPFRARKRLANAHAAEILSSEEFQKILWSCPELPQSGCSNIADMRHYLEMTELSRLVLLSTYEPLWQGKITIGRVREELDSLKEGDFDCLRDALGDEKSDRKHILFIPDVAGGFMLDIAFLQSLLRQGHAVIIALKDAFYFNSPSIADVEDEKLLKKALDNALSLHEEQISKTRLLQLLRAHRFLVISDGTSEQLNLYRTNVTFARAWKESDLIIAKGHRNKQVLLDSSHEFTRDIICYWRDKKGLFQIARKAKSASAYRFPEKEILALSRGIIRQMQEARDSGKTVMFYSAIIGSIPGQTKTAISVVNAFVAHLRERMEQVFVINPAEHFEEGMDGDDLMYMWEYVQRSGLLDVWRFQTVEDIEASFALMHRKVPAAWSGKDSTFSTGCTQEMRIALDEQQKHPEMQIIGPAPERFFRRRDYGIGKYFDASIKA